MYASDTTSWRINLKRCKIIDLDGFKLQGDLKYCFNRIEFGESLTTESDVEVLIKEMANTNLIDSLQQTYVRSEYIPYFQEAFGHSANVFEDISS